MRLNLLLIKICIRKSIVPEKEPAGWHDYYKFNDGTFQIAFGEWLFYTWK